MKEKAFALKNKLIEYRRQIHMHPELGFQEFKTTQLIQDKLKELDIEFKVYAKTGVVGTIKGEMGSGKRLMIRADMDALPINEENDKPYASKIKDVMHACGHDFHVACLLGTAELLVNAKSKFKGTVDLLFQPAEEGVKNIGGGALPMIEEGAIGTEENRIDAAIALHVFNNTRVGSIHISSGITTGSSDEFEITVNGIGGHASEPQNAVDPIHIAMQIGIALQGWMSRTFDPSIGKVLTIGKFEGGVRQNIIPKNAKMWGTIRTHDESLREEIKEKLPIFVNSIAKTFGATADTDMFTKYGVGYNDEYLTELIKETYESMFNNDYEMLDLKILGAEDFYDFGLKGKIPVSMFMLDAYNEEKGFTAQNHSQQFDGDEDCIPYGTATLAQTAVRYLNEN